MEIDCHKRSVDRYVKVKKGDALLYGLVKVSATLVIDFIAISGLILRLGR